ncbi:MAG TPA: hypothetical protein VI056_05965 [Candidatus Limnocylindria bacterium]
MNTPSEMPPVEPAAETTTTELDAARLKEITKQLAGDVRPIVEHGVAAVVDRAEPLVERARRWADVMLPVSDEIGPIINDLRPVVQDWRAQLSERLPVVSAATARLAGRFYRGPVVSAGRLAGTSARRLASSRPTLPSAGPSLSMPTIHAPRIASPVVRMPSLRMGAAVRSLARRLRPGRWAFRTVAIGLIVFVVSNEQLRDAMVDEVNWTRSVVQTIELPTIQLPTVDLPTFQIPNIEIPAFQFSKPETTAPPKLAPAQFELPPLNAYRAVFETQATYPTVPPNATVEWVVALRNTGSAGWYRGVAGAQAALALTDGTEVAVQTTPYVAPGQVGWFIAHFRAPAAPGAHAVPLFPRIDGRGELPNLGIYALVTVR